MRRFKTLWLSAVMRQPCAFMSRSTTKTSPSLPPSYGGNPSSFTTQWKKHRQASQPRQNSLTPPTADWVLCLVTSQSHRSGFSGWKKKEAGFVLGENRAGTLSACAACKHPFFLQHERQGGLVTVTWIHMGMGRQARTYTRTNYSEKHRHTGTNIANKRLFLEIFITFSYFKACWLCLLWHDPTSFLWQVRDHYNANSF